MEERFVPLSLPFLIADAECPDISLFDGDSLRVKFLDYQELLFELEFSKIIGFKWSIDELDYPSLANDCAYEVTNSKWLDEYRRIGEPVSKHKHYKLCFNACGVLDVIFVEMKIINSPKS